MRFRNEKMLITGDDILVRVRVELQVREEHTEDAGHPLLRAPATQPVGLRSNFVI